MRKVLTFFKTNWKYIFKGLLFVLTTLIIFYLFPHEVKFPYEFSKGKTWLHNDLYAPYNFAISKTKKELDHERDSLLNSAFLYFRYDGQVLEKHLSSFENKFNIAWEKSFLSNNDNGNRDSLSDSLPHKKLRSSKPNYFNFALNILNNIYQTGIIQIPEPARTKLIKNQVFVLLRNNIAEEMTLDEIYDIQQAIEYIRKETADTWKDGINPTFFRSFDLSEFIFANITYDEENTSLYKSNLIENISLTSGMVQQGELIIAEGDFVDTHHFSVLESFRHEYEASSGYSSTKYQILGGQLIIILTSILVLFLFLFNYRKDILQHGLKTSFILILVIIFVLLASLTIKFNVLNLYIVPFAILPIIIRTFYDTRTALFIHIVTVLLIGFLAPNGFEFVFLQIIAGMVANFSLARVKRRGQLFMSALLVFITYSVVYFGMAIIQESNLKDIEWNNFAWFAVNGLLLLSSYPLIYVFEKVFGFISDVTLMELSDTNHPLLRKLSEKAPGTFQHSLLVANLAEDAIFHIGGNAMLVRAGALYHDIGKLDIPNFFIENQIPGINPHDDFEFDKSAEIIISHVESGIEIARKHNIPEPIIDFIHTHHGTSRVQYFYKSFIKKYPDSEIDLAKFTYPGPTPFSKETSVVMMADCVEAASRSLKEFTEESISDLVESVINFKLNQNQFDNADITFKDITVVKDVLKKKLKNIYHARIEYPR